MLPRENVIIKERLIVYRKVEPLRVVEQLLEFQVGYLVLAVL